MTILGISNSYVNFLGLSHWHSILRLYRVELYRHTVELLIVIDFDDTVYTNEGKKRNEVANMVEIICQCLDKSMWRASLFKII